MFNLLRYFSATRAVVLLVTTVLLALVYRHATISNLIENGESSNAALAAALANSIWPEFGPYVTSVSGLGGDELRTRQETAQLREAVFAQMRGLSVVKVKIYNSSGLTVFSTEEAQIGDDKSANAGFISAIAGKIASELTHRDTFSAFENVIEDRDVLSSYIPIRTADGQIQGVFEIYDDVTTLLHKMDGMQFLVIVGSLILFSGLYIILFLIVRHADSILKNQHNDLRDHREELGRNNALLETQIGERVRAEEALRCLNEELEQRVHKRTVEVQQKASELERALEVQKQYNELQREFITMASHEFRTPLAIIDAAVQGIMRLHDRLKPEDIKERTGTIREAVARMTQLIESTLNAGRLDAGKIPMNPQPVDLNRLIDEICKRQKEISPSHKISIDVPDFPQEIYADPELLDQVFTNLLSNAVKYSPGCPEISITGACDGEQVVVSVRDNGLGIPADEVARLFQRYFRASTSVGIAGTGIGLCLVKEFIEMHSGSVEVDSIEGKGSTFTIRLPIELQNETIRNTDARSNLTVSDGDTTIAVAE